MLADTLVEFFMGEIQPKTGVLIPKSRANRYITPPHSLLFNVAVNPALVTANKLITTVRAHPSAIHDPTTSEE